MTHANARAGLEAAHQQLERARAWLLDNHSGTVDSDRLTVIERELSGVIRGEVPGDIVELGCYRGAMSLWMRLILNCLGVSRRIAVYDSFAGLPAPGDVDGTHLRQGDVAATADDVKATHDQWNAPHPDIYPGWFSEVLPKHLPEKVCFTYLDGDFYDSIYTSLQHCVPRLSKGGVMIIDDYADIDVNPRAWNGLPGVKKACDDYFGAASPIRVLVGEGDLAFGLIRG